VIILDISSPPAKLAKAIAEMPDGGVMSERAAAMVPQLERTHDQYWNDFVHRTSSTRTTLSAVGPDRAAVLIRHGYINAAVACNAKFGGPGLAEIPDEH
jgi:hypothetical protein